MSCGYFDALAAVAGIRAEFDIGWQEESDTPWLTR
jgi:hypothetical protein